jgi:hypothetical protein
MISDTSIECQNASSKRQATSIEAAGPGGRRVEPLEARVRLSWMDFYRATQNVALTCRHLGSPARPSIAGRSAMIPGFNDSWRSAVIVLGDDASRLGLFP